MNNITAVISDGKFRFEIGNNEKGCYLRNEHTVIPNEFEKYSEKPINDMFMEACDLIGDYVEKYPYSFETVEETEIQPVYAGYPDESKENDEPLPKAGSDGAKGDETVHTVFVIFADNSIKRLKIDTGKPFKYLRNIQYLLGQIAGYCEFYTIELEKNSRVVDLKHLRKVCKSKIEQYDIFFEAVSGHINDYETLVVERKNESGGGL